MLLNIVMLSKKKNYQSFFNFGILMEHSNPFNFTSSVWPIPRLKYIVLINKYYYLASKSELGLCQKSENFLRGP